ncbi:MAG TPA: NUDIX domain-containing protein [Candidatus Saccharimonadales bacterium]|nr:NUDIX domain-containing protein [Candidatus Saccharimonadales bacterium]
MPQFASEYWPATCSRVEFIAAASPPALAVTAVKVYVFQDDSLLLTNITSRGWDLPGGHIEANETPRQAARRELKEETGATAQNLKLVGYLKVTNEKENERNKVYPKESCLLVYKGSGITIDAEHDFQLEARESRFVPLEQLPTVHHDWNTAKAQVVAYVRSCSL